MIDEKNFKCELVIDGGLRVDNMELLIECNLDVVILFLVIFKDKDGIIVGVKNCRKVIDEVVIKFGLE